MKRSVIDASVVMKLYIEQPLSDVARRWIGRSGECIAPALVWAEAANVLWKGRQRGDLSEEAVNMIVSRLLKLPLIIHPSVELIGDALESAVRYDRSVYDCLYLALAVRSQCAMVTADRRLVNALNNTPLNQYVKWLGEFD